jgi:hypothetical protein
MALVKLVAEVDELFRIVLFEMVFTPPSVLMPNALAPVVRLKMVLPEIVLFMVAEPVLIPQTSLVAELQS